MIPSEYIPAVQKGIEEAMNNGVVAGYPMVDIKVTVYDEAIMMLTQVNLHLRWLLLCVSKKVPRRPHHTCWSHS